MKHEITEADVIGFFEEATEKYAPMFPEMTELYATHCRLGVGLYGYIKGTNYETAQGYGDTFEEAAKQLREKLGTPENVAAKKREQAARLIAEADALEASK